MCSAVSAAIIWQTYLTARTNNQATTVYFENGEFTFQRHPKAYFVPLLDVKLHLASRWPINNHFNTVQFGNIPRADEDTLTVSIKERLYAAFMSSDSDLAARILNEVSWRFNPEFAISSISHSKLNGINPKQWPILREQNSRFNLKEVVETLDTTWLLSAFLFDRIGQRDSAIVYYRKYLRLLTLIEQPGANSSSFALSRRKSAIRGRLMVLERLPARDPLYDEYSYYLTLISLFLELSLQHRDFAPYLEAGYGWPSKTGRFYISEFRMEEVDTAVLNRLSELEQKHFHMEVCAFAASDVDFWKKRACLARVRAHASDSGKELAGLVLFKYFRNWSQTIITEIQRNYSEEPLPTQFTSAWTKQLREFDKEIPKLLIDRNIFLADDYLYWRMSVLYSVGEIDEAQNLLCQLAAEDPRASDFSHVARFLAQDREDGCR